MDKQLDNIIIKSRFLVLFQSIYTAIFILLFFILITLVVWSTVKNNELYVLDLSTQTQSQLFANDIEESYSFIKNAINNISQKGFPETTEQIRDWNNIAEVYKNTNKGIKYIALFDENFNLIRSYPENSYNFIPENIFNPDSTNQHSIDLFYPIYTDENLNGFVFSSIDIVAFTENLPFTASNYEFSISDSENLLYKTTNSEIKDTYPVSERPVNLNSIYNFKLTTWPSSLFYRNSLTKANQFLYYGTAFSFLLFILIMLLQNIVKKSLKMKKQNELFIKQLENEQRLESIGLLSSSVAHEINNPINGIMNYSQLIKDSLESDVDEYTYADEILKETERVAALVQNILRFSRTTNEQFSYARIKDILQRTSTLAVTLLYKDNIVLEINCPENLPDIRCNSNKLQQVLLNLIFNSRDAVIEKYPTNNENKKINVNVESSLKDDQHGVLFSVTDFGAGIKEENQQHIFESFFTTKPYGIGTGLGLFITRQIIDDHKGKIWFESTYGLGTTFYIFIPFRD